MKVFSLSLTALACLMCHAAVAQDCGAPPDCCVQCGSSHACQPVVCQVVCEMKKVKKYGWKVECEEFCAPLPGCRSRGCGSACGTGCGASLGCKGCGPAPIVPPRCTSVRCKKKLVKHTYTVEVPVYKCVVQNLCSGCSDGAGPSAAPAPAPQEAPKAPKPATSQIAPLPPIVSEAGYLKGRLK